MIRGWNQPPFGMSADQWKLLKWSLMLAAILWTLIFQLGDDSQSLPEFIYVNF